MEFIALYSQILRSWHYQPLSECCTLVAQNCVKLQSTMIFCASPPGGNGRAEGAAVPARKREEGSGAEAEQPGSSRTGIPGPHRAPEIGSGRTKGAEDEVPKLS